MARLRPFAVRSLPAGSGSLSRTALAALLLLLAACSQVPEAMPPAAEEGSPVWRQARERGIDFRAVGQEPGWVLEFDGEGALRFAYDYGSSEITVPAPAVVVERGSASTTYRADADGQSLTVAVERAPCTDTMSGERFEARVEVTLDDEVFRGCGRWLGD